MQEEAYFFLFHSIGPHNGSLHTGFKSSSTVCQMESCQLTSSLHVSPGLPVAGPAAPPWPWTQQLQVEHLAPTNRANSWIPRQPFRLVSNCITSSGSQVQNYGLPGAPQPAFVSQPHVVFEP